MTNNEITVNDYSSTRLSRARLTLKVDGPYFPMEKFQKLLQSFSTILTEIDREISDTGQVGVEWAITEVQQGSISITAEANIIDDQVEIERNQKIIDVFIDGLELIKQTPQHPLYFTTKALYNLKVFSELIDPNDFAEIKFSTENWRFNVTKNLAANIDEITKTFYSIYGSIEGQLVSISIANRQNMGIRSLTDDKIIKCFFPEELFEQAREALGKRVYVFGLIRQYLHGEKINIQVQELKVFPEKSASSSLSNIVNSIRGEF
jgi:hypothetical protein